MNQKNNEPESASLSALEEKVQKIDSAQSFNSKRTNDLVSDVKAIETKLPFGRFNLAPQKPQPYEQNGEIQSYNGVSNTERNRIASYRPQATTYNTASLGRRASQEDGTVVVGSGGGAAQTGPHPWQITLRTEEDETEFKVELNSFLYKGLEDWEIIEVSGLDEWKTAGEGYIILRGNVSNLECNKALIVDSQQSLPKRINFFGEKQDVFSVQLGYLYIVDNIFFVRQNSFQNLTIIDTCVGGKSAIYPIPT